MKDWYKAATAAGELLKTAREVERNARDDAKTVAIKAVDNGVPEADVARRLGVDRMTVRKWRGKASA